MLAYRDPATWHEILEIGERLLAPGGFLMQYDSVREGVASDYGNVLIMQRYVVSKSLGLQLDGSAQQDRRGSVLLVRKKD